MRKRENKDYFGLNEWFSCVSDDFFQKVD